MYNGAAPAEEITRAEIAEITNDLDRVSGSSSGKLANAVDQPPDRVVGWEAQRILAGTALVAPVAGFLDGRSAWNSSRGFAFRIQLLQASMARWADVR